MPTAEWIKNHPLHYEPRSHHTIDVKLATMRAALAAGKDPNERDGIEYRSHGRPLHYAILDYAAAPYSGLMQNLPVIKLLMEAGADPRMPLRDGKLDPSPLELARRWLECFEEDGHTWHQSDIDLHPFFESAYREMKKVADKLDAQDEAQREKDALLEKRGYKPNNSIIGTIFGWLKFW